MYHINIIKLVVGWLVGCFDFFWICSPVVMRRIALRIWGFDLFTYCNGLGSLWGGIAIVFKPFLFLFYSFFSSQRILL